MNHENIDVNRDNIQEVISENKNGFIVIDVHTNESVKCIEVHDPNLNPNHNYNQTMVLESYYGNDLQTSRVEAIDKTIEAINKNELHN